MALQNVILLLDNRKVWLLLLFFFAPKLSQLLSWWLKPPQVVCWREKVCDNIWNFAPLKFWLYRTARYFQKWLQRWCFSIISCLKFLCAPRLGARISGKLWAISMRRSILIMTWLILKLKAYKTIKKTGATSQFMIICKWLDWTYIPVFRFEGERERARSFIFKDQRVSWVTFIKIGFDLKLAFPIVEDFPVLQERFEIENSNQRPEIDYEDSTKFKNRHSLLPSWFLSLEVYEKPVTFKTSKLTSELDHGCQLLILLKVHKTPHISRP